MSFKDYLKENLQQESNGEIKPVNGKEISSSIKSDIKLKDGTVLPTGTKIKYMFVTNGSRYGIYITDVGMELERELPIKLNITPKIRGIQKPPSTQKLDKMSVDSVVSSVTGKKVEPDGTGVDGSPSWLLHLGII